MRRAGRAVTLLCGLLVAIIASGFALRASGNALSDPATPSPPSGPDRYAVVMVVDGARFDEFDLSRMPNLARLVKGGTSYRQAFVGQLPSVTEASHATIGTGVYPSRHGILGDTWRVPGTETMAPNLLDGTLDRTGYIGHMILQARVPSLAGIMHQRYPHGTVASISGHKVYAAGAMSAGRADIVAFGTNDARGHFVPGGTPGRTPSQSILSDSTLDLPSYPRRAGEEDDWTTRLAQRLATGYRPRVLMINYPEMDVAGHTFGMHTAALEPIMAGIDRDIGSLIQAYQSAGLLARTDWIITADHGMVPATHTVSSDVVERVIRASGGNPLYVGHGDYCPIWLKNAMAIPRVASALSDARIPNVTAVFMKNPAGRYVLASPASGLPSPDLHQAYGDLLATFDNASSPDIVLLYRENTMTMTPFYRKIGRRGDHEGATWGSQHIELVLYGPDIHSGNVSDYPARLVDIAPTVETLLGARPSRQDGAPLADAMIAPPTWAAARAASHLDRGLADVHALEQQAASLEE